MRRLRALRAWTCVLLVAEGDLHHRPFAKQSKCAAHLANASATHLCWDFSGHRAWPAAGILRGKRRQRTILTQALKRRPRCHSGRSRPAFSFAFAAARFLRPARFVGTNASACAVEVLRRIERFSLEASLFYPVDLEGSERIREASSAMRFACPALHYFLGNSMHKITTLDDNWMGRPKSIGTALLESDGHRAIVDPGPGSTLDTLKKQLRAHGISVSDLDAILLTHIHLDHAGASGALVKENPRLAVYVHTRGAQ